MQHGSTLWLYPFVLKTNEYISIILKLIDDATIRTGEPVSRQVGSKVE